MLVGAEEQHNNLSSFLDETNKHEHEPVFFPVSIVLINEYGVRVGSKEESRNEPVSLPTVKMILSDVDKLRGDCGQICQSLKA